MHEGIRVHDLDRGAELRDGAVAAAERLVRREDERGPQALSRAEQRVPDRAGDAIVEQRAGAFAPTLQHRVHPTAGGGQVGFDAALSGRGAQGPS